MAGAGGGARRRPAPTAGKLLTLARPRFAQTRAGALSRAGAPPEVAPPEAGQLRGGRWTSVSPPLGQPTVGWGRRGSVAAIAESRSDAGVVPSPLKEPDVVTNGSVDGRTARGKNRGRESGTCPLGRYLMCVHVEPERTQIAVLEGRSLVEHYVARPQDEAQQITATSTGAG